MRVGVNFSRRAVSRPAGVPYADCRAPCRLIKIPQLAGTADGYFDDDTPIIEQLTAAKPDLLLVCLGSPKQELWMHQHAGQVQAGLMAGLGGSLDVFAGVVQRAPERWQKLGLEWLYRLLKEPKRIGRMMKLPQFALCAVKERVTGK